MVVRKADGRHQLYGVKAYPYPSSPPLIPPKRGRKGKEQGARGFFYANGDLKIKKYCYSFDNCNFIHTFAIGMLIIITENTNHSAIIA